MKYLLILVSAVLVGFVGFMMYHLGAFKSVEISEETRGPLILLYKDFTGPYHKTVSVIEEVEKWAQSQNISCELSFGEYPDNPETVEEARLRSRGGCIVSEAPQNLPADFKVMTVAPRKYVVAVFSGSPGIGPMKVYPKVNDYMIKREYKQDGAVMEIYQIHSRTERNSMTTTYLFPLF